MPVSAAPISGDPTFLLPNNATTNDPYKFTSPRVVANGYGLSSFYFDELGNQVSQQIGPVFSMAPGSLSWGIPNSYSNLYADPGSFEAKAYHYAWTDGSLNYYSYGSSQVWNWFVLEGNPGQVTLVADILVQGRAYANNADRGNAATIFGTSLGFLSSPADLTQDYAMMFYGTVGWTAGLAENNTVDVSPYWGIGSETHEVNYIVRSQPFTVTVGEPFRLSLLTSTQGFAGPGGWGEAWSDFYDPMLVTSDDFPNIPELMPGGFAVYSGGNYFNPASLGYSVAPVPEPSTLLLLGSGLVGLAGLRRLRGRIRFRRKE